MNNQEDELLDSPITVYDVFLSHASEDKPYVREVASGLKKRGITFCMDEIDFIAGMSLRQQIDASISASFTTVLFLSSQFFLKGWTRQEFDGAFALENHGLPKLLPVWLNVDKEAVTRYSPMLAARLAIRANDNADETADKIASQFEKLLCFSQSWGHIVRIDTKCLPWFAPPSFNHKSLKVLDDFFPYFWSHPRQSESLPGFSDAVVSNIGEALLDPTGLDGKCVFIVGQQNLVQVYNRHQNDRLEWVFQLTTNVPEYKNSVIYVRCAGHAGSDDDWPKAPMGYSTVVMGYVIAHGPMTLSNYTITSALYVVAFNVMHLPSISNQAVQRKSTILGNLCSKLFKR